MQVNPKLWFACAGLLLFGAVPAKALQEYCSDVCVYGGTSGGVTAAVQAAQMGKTVTLVVVNNHLGGMSSGGLGETDIGSFGATYIQGLALEFYTRVGAYYGSGATFTFEPHVAEQAFDEMVAEAGVTVCTNQYLTSIVMQNQQIVGLIMNNSNLFRAKEFVDASYEGDVMAAAGVTYTLGREAATQYNESYNGVRPPNSGGQQFGSVDVNPYVETNDPSSGLIPLMESGSVPAAGSADQRIQAYNVRMCLTTVASNLIPITAPTNYDASQYQLLARYIQALEAAGTTPALGTFMGISSMPNNKTDINNNGPVSTDFIGQSSAYPAANYATRAQIWQAHKNYTQGLFYFLAHDSSVPSSVQSEAQSYGLCQDEFADNGHWPYALYVREARRMISDYIMTQSNCMGTAVAPDSIGVAAYGIDSHNCERLVVSGYAENEGDTEIGITAPYPVSYRSIIPSVGQCTNLLVPWCLSASHIGFGSIRLEPEFMILGQSAGAAAALAADGPVAVQQLSLAQLQAQLLANGQMLSWGVGNNGIIVDNTNQTGVTIVGTWLSSTAISGYYGTNYLDDGNENKGGSSVTFTPTLPSAGTYQVYARWTSYSNRANNVPIDIISSTWTNTVYVDQTQQGGEWVLLLTTNFNAGTTGKVRIRNAGTTEYVIANAVEFINVTNLPIANVWATDASASRYGPRAGSFTVSRTGTTNAALTVNLTLGGTAVNGTDYVSLPNSVVLPAGVTSTNLSVVPYTNSAPVGNKTLIVSLAASSSYSTGALAAATVNIYDVPLFQWRLQYFGTNALNAAVAGDGANPAGDGIPNLVKYALGLNPLSAAARPMVTPAVDSNGLFSLSYTRPDPPPVDLNYQVEISTNLLTWSADASCSQMSALLLTNNNASAIVTLKATTPVSQAAHTFRLLQVSRK
jgi:hypothetical protein